MKKTYPRYTNECTGEISYGKASDLRFYCQITDRLSEQKLKTSVILRSNATKNP